MKHLYSTAQSIRENIWVIYIIFLSIFILFNRYSYIVIIPFIICSVVIPLLSTSTLTCLSIIAMNIFMSIEFTTIQADSRVEIINQLKWYVFFIIVLFIQFSRICYLAKKQLVPDIQTHQLFLIRFYQNVIKNFLRIIIRIYEYFPIISYVILTGILIFGFANFYNNQNKYFVKSNNSDGYYMKTYENVISSNEDMIRIPPYKNYQDVSNLINNLYFSTTTFYTVGFGDIDIIGIIPKMTVQLEMLMSNILLAVFLPLSFRYLTDKKNK